MSAFQIIRSCELPACPSLEVVAPAMEPGSRAVFCKGRNYQYSHARIWDDASPVLFSVGLFPLSPGGAPADQFFTKLTKISRVNGFGAFMLVNISAQVADDTAAWEAAGKREGDSNNEQLRRVLGALADGEQRRTVLLAWGTEGPALASWPVTTKFHSRVRLVSLGQTDSGRPRHPLRLSAATPFEPVKATVRPRGDTNNHRPPLTARI